MRSEERPPNVPMISASVMLATIIHALDSTIASMTQTSNYLTQQLASLSSFA